MVPNQSILVKRWGRIQAGQLVHDLCTVPKDGVEFEEAVQRVLQTVQLLVGQSCGGREQRKEVAESLKVHG